MAFGGMTAVMDQLVSGARSLRDTTFNTMDAVQRRTAAASDEIAARVQAFNSEHDKRSVRSSPDEDVRDDRFDPEDEWELPGHPGTPAPAPDSGAHLAAGRPVGGATSSSRTARDDEDDYPDTWLR